MPNHIRLATFMTDSSKQRCGTHATPRFQRRADRQSRKITTENTEHTEKRQKRESKSKARYTVSRTIAVFSPYFLSFFRVFRVFRGDWSFSLRLFADVEFEFPALFAVAAEAPQFQRADLRHLAVQMHRHRLPFLRRRFQRRRQGA